MSRAASVLWGILGLSLVAPAGLARAVEPLAAELTERVEIADTRVSIELPAGFAVSEDFPGIVHEETPSSIVVSEIPLPRREVLGWLEPDALEARGIELIDAAEIQLDGEQASLHYVAEEHGEVELRRWILVYGDASGAAMIVATTHEALETWMGRHLVTALVSARWHREQDIDLFAGLDFRISRTGRLAFAPRPRGGLVLIRSDQIGVVTGGDPRFIVEQFPKDVEIEDLERLAHEHLALTHQAASVENASGRRLALDGLEAYEIVADGSDFETLVPLLVYQVLAIDAERYYVLRGFADHGERDRHLDEFRSITRSFRRIP